MVSFSIDSSERRALGMLRQLDTFLTLTVLLSQGTEKSVGNFGAICAAISFATNSLFVKGLDKEKLSE